jgi:dipeptidyl aminopeptidase/acylaminoacyl peptidase
MYADKINSPLLLVHGDADANSGTTLLQSEAMYEAIKGNGGMVRFVTMPYEGHTYEANESIQHLYYEMISWFDKYVKGPTSGKEAKLVNY